MRAGDLFRVDGLVVAITGAASGIGLAYAEVMAANGAFVTMIDIDRGALEPAVERLSNEGGRVFGAVADVTARDQMRAVFDGVVTRHGRLDVLFANAGISGGPGFLRAEGGRNPDAAFENLRLADLERVMAVNVASVFQSIQLVIPQMKRQSAGKIIVTSSVCSYRPDPHIGAIYLASKGAVGQLVRQLALELAEYNILVNAIAPSSVITNIAGGRLKSSEARVPFERSCPLRRLAVPDDMKGAALLLASSASSFITGTQVVIDGGTTLGAIG